MVPPGPGPGSPISPEGLHHMVLPCEGGPGNHVPPSFVAML